MQWCYRELAVQARDLPTAFAAAMQLTESTFGYIDRVSEQVLTAYVRERDEWVRNTVAVRTAQVRSLLAGGPIEVSRVEPALGYRLRQHHLGIVAWVEEAARKEGTLVELERMAGRLADHLSRGARALFVSRDESSAFIWMPLGSERVLRTDAFDGTPLVPDAVVRLAVGEPAEGPEGFRVTIREALRAHAVALMAGPAAPHVTRFAEVAPVALLAEDIGAARGWVSRALGPLAADDDQTARLRETCMFSCPPGAVTRRPPSGCRCTRTPCSTGCARPRRSGAARSPTTGSSSNWPCSPATGSGQRCSPRKGTDPLHHGVGIGVRRDGREHQVGRRGRVGAVPEPGAGDDAPAPGGLAGCSA